MIRGMPVKTVVILIKLRRPVLHHFKMLEKADVETEEMFKNDKEQFLNSVQKIVDRFHNIFTILLGRTVDDGETATDEVILNIDNHQS